MYTSRKTSPTDPNGLQYALRLKLLVDYSLREQIRVLVPVWHKTAHVVQLALGQYVTQVVNSVPMCVQQGLSRGYLTIDTIS
eukprot:COSAG02_NODE_31899_length_525_cov_1.154930_1_plen_82_part_00